MEKDKTIYTSLSGYPLQEPLWRAFFKTAGVQTGFVVSACAMATDIIAGTGVGLPALAGMAIVAPTVNIAHKYMEAILIDEEFGTNSARTPFKGKGKDLAIALRPPEYLETSSALISSAKATRKQANFVYGGFMGMSVLATAFVLNIVPREEGGRLLVGTLAGHILLSGVATFAACARRFDKVAKGEYVIVNAPQALDPKPAP